MADLNSVQNFATPNFNIEPVVKRNPNANVLGLQDLINVGRSATALEKEQALLQPSIEKGVAESKQQVLAAEKAGVDLNQYYANAARGVYGGYLTDPDFINGDKEAMLKKIQAGQRYLKEDLKIPSHDSGMNAQILKMAKDQPNQVYRFIQNTVQQGAGNAEQAQQLNRAPTPVSTGQGTQFVQTSPYQGGTNNQYVQGQVPIGTKQVAQPNDGSGLPPGTEYLVGPQGPQPVGYQVPGAQQGVTPAQMNAPANAQKPLVTSLAPSTTPNALPIS